MVASLYLKLEVCTLMGVLDLLCFDELIEYSECFVQEIDSCTVCILCRRYWCFVCF